MISWKKVSRNLTLERMGYTESIINIPRYRRPPNCGRTTCPRCSSRGEAPLFTAIKKFKINENLAISLSSYLILMLLCCKLQAASLTGLRVRLLNCRCYQRNWMDFGSSKWQNRNLSQTEINIAASEQVT